MYSNNILEYSRLYKKWIIRASIEWEFQLELNQNSNCNWKRPKIDNENNYNCFDVQWNKKEIKITILITDRNNCFSPKQFRLYAIHTYTHTFLCFYSCAYGCMCVCVYALSPSLSVWPSSAAGDSPARAAAVLEISKSKPQTHRRRTLRTHFGLPRTSTSSRCTPCSPQAA